MTGRDLHLRGDPGLVVSRRAGFDLAAATVDRRHGMVVLSLEQCLIDTWQEQPAQAMGRVGIIAAVRDRRASPEGIRVRLAGSAIADRPGLEKLLALLAAGCHSELEIWGHLHVFTAPAMPAFARQFRVRAGARVYYLDLAHIETRTAVELDGWQYHSGREQHDLDLQRDARLAAAGWLTLRYTSTRLHREPEAVRREVLAVIASRSAPAPQQLPA